MGPLPFLMCIINIAGTIEAQVHIIHFAHDCMVYSSVSSVEDQRLREDALQEIKHGCDRWCMKTNYDKFVSAHITYQRKLFSFNSGFGDTDLCTLKFCTNWVLLLKVFFDCSFTDGLYVTRIIVQLRTCL